MIVSVVIPCYKVEKHIEEVIKNLPVEVAYIIAVNDNSPDETGSILLRLQKEDKRIIYIRHEKNMGVGGAMISGYRKSIELKSDITVKMDGDNQMDVQYFSDILSPVKTKEADFSKGNRFIDYKTLKEMPWIRKVGNFGLSFLIKAASGYWNIFDPTNGFTAINYETLVNIDFNRIHKRYFFESSILIELYHVNAVVKDITMKAKYRNEISGLSIIKTLIEFPPKLFYAFVRRILLKYFLYDFNIASLYILVGLPFFLLGAIYGGVNFIKYAGQNIPAPTGTVVVPSLLIILGFQLLLAAIHIDIDNFPKKK